MPWWWTLCINLSATVLYCVKAMLSRHVLMWNWAWMMLDQSCCNVWTEFIQNWYKVTPGDSEKRRCLSMVMIFCQSFYQSIKFLVFGFVDCFGWVKAYPVHKRWSAMVFKEFTVQLRNRNSYPLHLIFSSVFQWLKLLSLFKCYRIWNIVLVTHKR